MTAAHEAMRRKARSIPLDLIVANAYAVPRLATTHEATIGARMREEARNAGHMGGEQKARPIKKSPPPRQSAHPPGTREILEWVEHEPQRRNRDGAKHLGIPFGRLEKRAAKLIDRGLIAKTPMSKADRFLGAILSITESGRRLLAKMREGNAA